MMSLLFNMLSRFVIAFSLVQFLGSSVAFKRRVSLLLMTSYLFTYYFHMLS